MRLLKNTLFLATNEMWNSASFLAQFQDQNETINWVNVFWFSQSKFSLIYFLSRVWRCKSRKYDESSSWQVVINRIFFVIVLFACFGSWHFTEFNLKPVLNFMKMANCCVCFKVRTGSYIIAFLDLVIGVLSFIASSYSIVKNSERYFQDRLYSTEVLLALIIGATFFVVIQFMLLYGLRRNRERAILFWLVTQAICCSVKFRYCEKATKFEKNLTLSFEFIRNVKTK